MFRVRCGGRVRNRGEVRVRQSESDFNKRGNNLAGARKWAKQHSTKSSCNFVTFNRLGYIKAVNMS